MSKEKEKKGRRHWTPEEDAILIANVNRHGEGDWGTVQKNSGLSRDKESCRKRWTCQLKPRFDKDPFTPKEEAQITKLHARLGNKWSLIAAQLPGRTGTDIKNHWKSCDMQRKLAERSQQQVGVSQATSNPDTTEKSSMLGQGSGSSQLPILCPNPDTTEKISMLGQGSGSSQLPILSPIPDTTGKSSMLGQGSGTGSSQLPIVFPNPDTTGKGSMLAQGSGSSQLPIVYPNPDMQQYNTSSAQLPSLTGLETQQGSSSSGLSGNVSLLTLNEQVDSNSTDEDSLYGAVKRFLKPPKKDK